LQLFYVVHGLDGYKRKECEKVPQVQETAAQNNGKDQEEEPFM